MKRSALRALAGGGLLSALLAAGLPGDDAGGRQPAAAGADWQWQLPPGVAPPPVPADNPMSRAKFELGRYLFYDKRLSGNGDISCASCHPQARAFSDGVALSIGAEGERALRNAQPLANAAWRRSYTWANYSLTTLERQMDGPLFRTDPVEMGINDGNLSTVLARLAADPHYQREFARAFPGQPRPLTLENIVKAIASFERGIVSFDSRYDRYRAGQTELSAAESRGLRLFRSEQGQCYRCHGSADFDDQMAGFSRDLPFHNIGLYNLDGKGGYPFPNRGALELSGKAADMGRFRSPSLRNVALTAPYMHDGSVATLEDAVRIHAEHGRRGGKAGDGRLNPWKDAAIDRIRLNRREQADIVAFLKTLSDDKLIHNPRLADPFAAKHGK
ncbi:methanobactin export MATE transporter MbnM [Chromobacterium sphagni]|uniref:Di-heme enzyme n=1 Tax=Chromobacterium sphagni TaxID=1903179 RepID=A0A1S1WZM6_9NEIS|nr:methanobactin export MATE transporter MbnM [Chromobacterium sphagni]OHX12737.1 di-heme enzyme [Chromobacterium sphagni]OHX21119.1 di-heme enzyme [Chromobacterium sphagni]